jgi:hypothetical protein
MVDVPSIGILDWKVISALIPAIVSAILSGGIFESSSGGSSNLPNVVADIIPNFSGSNNDVISNVTIMASNNGNARATNLTLTIFTPSRYHKPWRILHRKYNLEEI